MRLSVIRLFALTVPLAWLGSRLAGSTGIFAGILAANLLVALLAWWQIRLELARQARLVSTRAE